MTRIVTPQLFVAILLSVAVPAFSWTPNECGPDYGPKKEVFRQELLAAKPGSHLYTPHPYPTTPQEVFEDFVVTYGAIWQSAPTQAMPAEEKRLFAAIKNKTLTYTVATVEDWGLQRCLLRSPARFQYLIRLYDRKTGGEFARAAVKETGLWGGFQPLNADADPATVTAFQARIEPLEHAIQAAARLGFSGGKAQYVGTAGTLYCTMIEPCVAFQAGKNIMISKRGQLFEVTPNSRRLTGAEFSTTAPNRSAFLSTLDPTTERVVSLGFDQFAVARLVGQTKP